MPLKMNSVIKTVANDITKLNTPDAYRKLVKFMKNNNIGDNTYQRRRQPIKKRSVEHTG